MIETKSLLNRLLAHEDLGAAEMAELIGSMMDGGLSEPVMAGFLVALRAKGETSTEVAAAAGAMRARVKKVPVSGVDRAVDTCGTGGDGADTVNISTAAALVAAAAGVPVPKHGNRSVSSRCGSADVLESLGVALDLDNEQLGALCDEVGIAFLFAPKLHPAMKAVMPARRALGVRTVFNLLGPLTNPAGVRRQVVGVWGREVQDLVAEALAELGAHHAVVVHSDDGLDEVSVFAPTRVVEVREGKAVKEWRADPVQLGVRQFDPASLRGGDVSHNARRLSEILDGGERSAASEAVALNAGAALYVGGVAEDLVEGLQKAREILHSGTALTILKRLAARSTEMSDG
ncbi:MAG: anthranilate phosphoribosyltransferase [Thermoanaerobaculales bacterium]|nr:anthranilate phosphoribosyltransferase [Thermoanaerobaculales bacterium]